MLTELRVRNFKRFKDVRIELGNPVVFIGPNNSGKTAALQALALWHIGVQRWIEKRGSKETPIERPGVTINRRDLIAVPVPSGKLLWRDLHVRDVQKIEGKTKTKNVRIDIIVKGINEGKFWECGLEFDYANEEAFYCRPLRKSEDNDSERMPIPKEVADIRLAFLPPMSGLAATETRIIDMGAINVRLGEGRTAEVLRNLCYQIANLDDQKISWRRICDRMVELFGVNLDEPELNPIRGEITMTYRDKSNIRLDLSSSGRGLQQTLLLLAHLAVNHDSVLLLDEPDAHLEILRQRQIYQILAESALAQGSQIIAASHSEIILNEAADRDVVVAFVGKPHRIDDRGSQLLKSLKEIGFDQYYQAEQNGWVLYLEGSTDLAILKAFAETLGHKSKNLLDRPFVHYVQNQPATARNHFCGLIEAKPDLVAFALFDRLTQPISDTPKLKEYMWNRSEIENYLFSTETIIAFTKSLAKEKVAGPLLEWGEQEKLKNIMQECLEDLVPRAALRDSSDPWWIDTKASDFLDRLFKTFYKKVGIPNLMNKSDYHVLARHVPKEQIDPEVSQVLDAIYEVAEKSHPAKEES
jgi:ABC-type branched-subunit amino acid transport system ATPase component